jgi:hypothetical protein
MHYIFSITFIFGLSFASFSLLVDYLFGDPLSGAKKIFNFYDILRSYSISIIGGLIISILSLPFYIIGSKQKEPVSGYKKTDEKLKKIVFSNYFFISVFCFVSTLRLVFAKIFDKPLMIHDVALSYFFSLFVGFCFPRFILLGDKLWKKIAIHHKKTEIKLPNSSQKGAVSYVYCVMLLGFVYIGLGFGAFSFIFIRYICIVSYDTFRIVMDISTRVVPVGICFGNICYFYGIYNRLKQSTK